MERFALAVSTGEPVNPPIWWIAPADKIAQTIDDEFMLGEKYLAAPIVKKGLKILMFFICFFFLMKNSFQDTHRVTFICQLVTGLMEILEKITTP